MMLLGIGIIRTEKCWPNSPTYSTDVGVLRGWGRAQITVDILGRGAKKVEKHWDSTSAWRLTLVHCARGGGVVLEVRPVAERVENFCFLGKTANICHNFLSFDFNYKWHYENNNRQRQTHINH